MRTLERVLTYVHIHKELKDSLDIANQGGKNNDFSGVFRSVFHEFQKVV